MLSRFTPYALLIKIVVGITLLGLLFATGYRYGEKSVQAKWDIAKAAQVESDKTAILDNEQHNTDVQQAQSAANLRISKNHEATIAQLSKELAAARARIDIAGGLRVSRSVCANDKVSAGTETTSNSRRDADVAGTVALPQQITNDLLSLATDADHVTEVARSCQNWVRAQGMYGAAKNDFTQKMVAMAGKTGK